MKRVVALALGLVVFGCLSSAQVPKADPTGRWVGVAAGGEGQPDAHVTLTIKKTDGGYSASMSDDAMIPQTEIPSVAVKDNAVSFSVDVGGDGDQGFRIDFKMTLAGDKMEGTWSVGDMMTGTIKLEKK